MNRTRLYECVLIEYNDEKKRHVLIFGTLDEMKEMLREPITETPNGFVHEEDGVVVQGLFVPRDFGDNKTRIAVVPMGLGRVEYLDPQETNTMQAYELVLDMLGIVSAECEVNDSLVSALSFRAKGETQTVSLFRVNRGGVIFHTEDEQEEVE